MRHSILRDKSRAFALRIIKLYGYLKENKGEYVLSKQLLRSGTSIGANVAEAYYGQLEADFISKLSIAQKENAETIYWLELLHDSVLITEEQFNRINTDAVELIKLLTSSIKTMKSKNIITNH